MKAIAFKCSIREQLGEFQKEGGRLIQVTLDKNSPLPTTEADQWATKVEGYLAKKLGPSYVIRFRSGAGLPMPAFFNADASKQPLWSGLNTRVARLDQFSAEIAR
jgi:hypothetical protein